MMRVLITLGGLLGIAGLGWVALSGPGKFAQAGTFADPMLRPDTPQAQTLYLIEGVLDAPFGDADDWRFVGLFGAVSAGKAGDMRQRFATELEERAAAKDPLGLYIAANVHLRGLLGPADGAKGRELLLEAAELGHVGAQFEVGRALASGKSGFAADPGRAADWLRLAAANGHAQAAELLASKLSEGTQGFPQDCKAAWNYALQTQEAFDAQTVTWVHTPWLKGMIRIEDCQSLPALPEQAIVWLEEGARLENAVYGRELARYVAKLYRTHPTLKNQTKAAYWQAFAEE